MTQKLCDACQKPMLGFTTIHYRAEIYPGGNYDICEQCIKVIKLLFERD